MFSICTHSLYSIQVIPLNEPENYFGLQLNYAYAIESIY